MVGRVGLSRRAWVGVLLATVVLPLLPAAVCAAQFQQWHGWLPTYALLVFLPDVVLLGGFAALQHRRGCSPAVSLALAALGATGVAALAAWALHTEYAPNLWVVSLSGIRHVAGYRGSVHLDTWPLRAYAGLATFPVTLLFGTVPWLLLAWGTGGSLQRVPGLAAGAGIEHGERQP